MKNSEKMLLKLGRSCLGLSEINDIAVNGSSLMEFVFYGRSWKDKNARKWSPVGSIVWINGFEPESVCVYKDFPLPDYDNHNVTLARKALLESIARYGDQNERDK